MKTPEESFSCVVAPARRALENAGVKTPEQLFKIYGQTAPGIAWHGSKFHPEIEKCFKIERIIL
jgi:hypothetical protein